MALMLDPLGRSRFTGYMVAQGGDCPDLEKWIEIPDVEREKGYR